MDKPVNYKLLEVMGNVIIYLNTQTHEIILAIQTDVGTVSTNLSMERACQIGVSLIRESGKRFVIPNNQKAADHVQKTAIASGGGPSDATELNCDGGVEGRAKS